MDFQTRAVIAYLGIGNGRESRFTRHDQGILNRICKGLFIMMSVLRHQNGQDCSMRLDNHSSPLANCSQLQKRPKAGENELQEEI